MDPALAKRLSKAHWKAMPSLTIKIDFEPKGIGADQRERISCEFPWVLVTASEAILSKHAIIDFECGVAMRWVLASEIDLTQLWWFL